MFLNDKMGSIPDENLVSVYSANAFFARINRMKAYQFPDYDTPAINYQDKHLADIGGGNTALDSVRVALRLGEKKGSRIFHRSVKEVPARIREIEHTREERVHYLFLNTPTTYFGDENSWLKTMQVIKMELGQPDESGRRRPMAITV